MSLTTCWNATLGLSLDKFLLTSDHRGESVGFPAKLSSSYGRSWGGGFHENTCNKSIFFFTNGDMGPYWFEGVARNRVFSPLHSHPARNKKTRRSSLYMVHRISAPFEVGSGAYGARTRNLCRDRAAL